MIVRKQCWETWLPLHEKFLSPMQNLFMERSSHIAPHPSTRKIPLKNSVYFPITRTICKQWEKSIVCSPSPGDCIGQVILKDMGNTFFNNAEKMAIEKKFQTALGKMSLGGGLAPLQYFEYLNSAQEILISSQMPPLPVLLWSLVRYDRPWEKAKKTTNKHASVIFLPAKKKKQNSKFLYIGAWILYSKILLYPESDVVIFIRITWVFGGVHSFFRN